MKETIKILLNETQNNIHSVVCQNCKVATNHKVVISANERGEAPMDYDDVYQWHNEYEIIQCLGCETISFRLEQTNSEEYGIGEDGGSYADIQVYPKRSKDTWNVKSFYNVPNNLSRIYKETIDCYNNENFTLCGAGARALVEGLCKVNGIENGNVEIKKDDDTIKVEKRNNLQGKINGLHQQGILTKKNAEILHEHRFLGNTSIHELNTPSMEELSLAIEIIENVFDSLYEMPNKANQLKYKRLLKDK
ncbi:MAG: DUF4145 domain-containing protein [Bacteroidales bacterium]|nr:DUF4145 domain-containing protein [Bacteroidales bacterium]